MQYTCDQKKLTDSQLGPTRDQKLQEIMTEENTTN